MKYLFVAILTVATLTHAEIKHRFVVADEPGHRIVHIDQNNPKNNWELPVTEKKAWDLQLVGDNQLAVSFTGGYLLVDLDSGKLIEKVAISQSIQIAISSRRERFRSLSVSRFRSLSVALLASPIGPDEIHLPRPAAEEGGTHMGTWLHAVRTGNRSALNAPVEVGHRSATVCHLANLAVEIERPLRWDAQTEQFVDDPEANRLLTRATRQPWRI